MKLYLHSDNAERQANYRVTICPAGDIHFNKPDAKGEFPREWVLADGTPRQFEIIFSFGVAEVEESLGKYMLARGIAHKSRMLRKIFQLFNRDGQPIEEIFDSHGNRVLLDGQAAA